MRHYWIYELIVTDVGSYGLFHSVEAAEQEMRLNSIVWDSRAAEGLACTYYNNKHVMARLSPKPVFYSN